MSEFTLAAALVGIRAPLDLIEIQLPQLRKNQVLLEMYSASICGSQVSEWQGGRDNAKWLPHLMGHEGFGIVSAIGPGVQNFRVGQPVIASWISNGLEPSEPPLYRSRDGKEIGAGKVAIFARRAIVSQDKIYRIQDFSLFPDSSLFSLLGCAFPTGAGMVFQIPSLSHSSKVLLKGVGGVGGATAIALNEVHSGEKFAFDRNVSRHVFAQNLGFKVLSEKEIRRDYFDIVFDNTGDIDSLQDSFLSLSNHGTLVFASHPPIGSRLSIDPYRILEGRSLIGTWGGGIKSQQDFDILISRFSEKGKIAKLAGPKFMFSEINEAMEYSKNPDQGRAILIMSN
jgi:S-(hydroxymethyl)glutathione dehydrogenase / alcohol dehydrogenase